ncbi:Olfactory receptor 2T27 [Sciurus carolinensis]|uniref:Olfactory receptor 2T27 n=1 Tax=Sciurus carolinensis TaxID=30640 RepID=A0AA41T7G8_SCICA|nr:Olfactory receptor 2T27 [Sciurus carolinensis]
MNFLYTSTIVPKILLDQAKNQRAISFAGCTTSQHFLYLTLAGTEFFLPGLLSYDHFIAICNPRTTLLFYGAANYMDMLPHSYHNPERDKAVSTFYTILMPMLNSLIYSLRNKDVTGALQRALGKCLSSGKVTTF